MLSKFLKIMKFKIIYSLIIKYQIIKLILKNNIYTFKTNKTFQNNLIYNQKKIYNVINLYKKNLTLNKH